VCCFLQGAKVEDTKLVSRGGDKMSQVVGVTVGRGSARSLVCDGRSSVRSVARRKPLVGPSSCRPPCRRAEAMSRFSVRRRKLAAAPLSARRAPRTVHTFTRADYDPPRSLYIGWNDVTESMVTIRSPFCGYNLA